MYYKIVKQTLNNGLKVGFVDYPVGDLCCVHLRGKIGSNYEMYSNIGSSHLLEHVLLGSSTPTTLGSNGSKVIGITSRDDVLFGFKILKNNLFDVIDFSKQLLNRDITIPSEIDIYKNSVYSEIFRHRNSPEKYITRLIYKSIFPDNRISILNTGNVEHVRNLKNTHLTNFYLKNYIPSNFGVLICARLSQDKQRQILAQLSEIRQIKAESNGISKLLKNPKKTIFVENSSGLAGSLVKINYLGFTVENKDKYSLLMFCELINLLLANSSGFRVTCSSFSTASYGLFDISFGTDNKDWEFLADKVIALIESAEINSKTLKLLKSRVITRFLLSLDKMTSLTDYYSELLLFGNSQQDMGYEIKAIKNVSLDDFYKIKNYIIKQSPIITVLM